MDPFAYGLRDHEIFRTPFRVDKAKSTTVQVPAAWKHALGNGSIDVLPLVTDTERRYRSGWCTYVYAHSQAPEVELFCSGINAKTPKASAIWRQGNLLHFGFEQSPAEFNENGIALLVNSIVYISQFTEDRPILHTPSPFYSSTRVFDRGTIDRLVERQDRDLDTLLQYYLAADAQVQVKGKSRKELAEWFCGVRAYIHADRRGKLTVDDQARDLGVAPDSFEFFDAAISALQSDDTRHKEARELLGRYAPNGPGVEAATLDWKKWVESNRRYLFFSDSGGYRWYVDPLAKSRGVPTASLRGPARATR